MKLRILIFIFALSLIASPSYGVDVEDIYVVEKPDTTLAIIHKIKGSKDTIQDILKELKYEGLPYHKIKRSDVEVDAEDKNFRKWDNGKVVLDPVKKQQWEDKKAEKENKKKDVLQKLGISEKEWEELTDKEVNDVA